MELQFWARPGGHRQPVFAEGKRQACPGGLRHGAGAGHLCEPGAAHQPLNGGRGGFNPCPHRPLRDAASPGGPGLSGRHHATPSTLALCDIMLRDSAHIQEMEAEWQNRKAQRAGEGPYVPIYTQADAEAALQLFRPLPLMQTREILPGVRLSFSDAGHLLGSASATLEITEGEVSKTIVFSGDIGNLNQPIIKDPQYLSRADYVVMESTYGDRLHGPRPDYLADLADTLQITFNRGGNVVIPSFAVGRTQEILYFLREIKEKGMVKGHAGFPVYMDSPLAIKATTIFMDADRSEFDEEMQALLDQGINPITFPDLVVCETAEESKQINFETRPCVIISASGMAEAGRIRHHLEAQPLAQGEHGAVCGLSGGGTLGRMLYDGEKRVEAVRGNHQCGCGNQDPEGHQRTRGPGRAHHLD